MLLLEALEDRTVPAAGVSAMQWSNLNVAWQNGDLNRNQATLLEGDSVAYRDVFSGLSVGPGNTYVITITWQTTNTGKHALDYLTSYDYTWHGGSGSGTSVDGHELAGTGLPSSTPFTTFQIPIDPNINSGPPNNFMINGRTPVGSPANPPNQFFRMYGATLTGASGYTTYALTGTTFQTLSISFTPSVSNPVLLWGGHIASQLDWGPGSGAGSIPGAPYHMSQVSLKLPDGTTTSPGSQDLSLHADAVTFPTLIVVNKSAVTTLSSEDFNFTNPRNVFSVPGQPTNFVNSFSLDGSNTFAVPPYTLPGSTGENVELLQTKAFGQTALTRITEALPAGWTLTGISIHSLNGNAGSSSSGTTAILNCVENDTLWVTFTDTFRGTSTTATEIRDASGGPATGAPGESVFDTATVTGNPAAFTPTGTVTYQFFTNSTGTGTPSTTETVTLNADGTVPDSALHGPLAAGSYSFTAVYSGDSHYAGSRSPVEPLAVGSNVSNTTTEIRDAGGGPPLGVAGESVFDTATVTGNPASAIPTGQVTYQFFTTIDGTGPHTDQTVTLNADGTVPDSALHGPLAAGSYSFIAVYHNGNFADSTSAVEPLTVSRASPMLTTTPNLTTVTLADTAPPILKDTATLSGGFDPTGTITFDLFQGSTLVHTETVPVTGTGNYATPTGFTLPTSGTAAGTYEWVASYSGDANNNALSDTNADEEKVVVSPATPTLTTTPDPTTVTLGPDPVTLKDTATLSGGYDPTGDIVFELFHNGGSEPVFTEPVPVAGNGPYTTPTGFTLPISGTVTGNYQWVVVFYSGDANNDTANESDPTEERVTVSPASPMLVTTASPAVRLPAGPPGTVTLSDSAVLSGGYFPTGSIAFTLSGPGGFSFTTDVPVSGNGPYTASTTLPTTGMVAGSYTWTAHYSGDDNNSTADDQGGSAEHTLVNPANPMLVTTANPAIRRSTAPTTLTDTAVLSGGYFPTGNIVFTLSGPGGFSFTQTDTVSGNGTYTATAPLPTTGTLAGSYTWTAHYSGDDNNTADDDQGGSVEQVTVAPFSPTITTIPIPSTANVGARLQDTATLSGGFNPTGSITFRLYAPGVDPTNPAATATYTETVSGVSGDGTYHTSVGFVSNATGIWHWVATYNGDQNNNQASNDPLDEPVTIAPAADIALTKTVQPSQVMYGQNVTFTLIVHNKGPDTATDVFVDDPLPSGLAFVMATPSQGTFAPGSGLWMVGTLANGATATLRLTYRVATFGPLVNRAEAGADQFDPNLSNNVASATVTGTNPAPIISKRSFLASSDPPPALPAAGPARPLPALAAVRADIVFINGLYEGALGRDAKPAELAYWVNQLLLGVSRSAVARRV